MAGDFDCRCMYNWAVGLVDIVDAYERHFDGAPTDVSRLFTALKSDARGLRDALADRIFTEVTS